jgi:hypothetical protein
MAITSLTPIGLPNLPAAPTSPAAGWMYFDTVLGAPYCYNGSVWVPMSAASAPVPRTVVGFDLTATARYAGSNTGTASARTFGTAGLTMTTGTTSGGRSDVIIQPLASGSSVWLERNAVHTWLMDMTTQGTEFDLFLGLSSSVTSITTATSVTTTGGLLGFLLERRASASQWKAISNNGGALSSTNFSGPGNFDDGLLSIRYVASTTSYEFYYNGTLVAEHTIGVESSPAHTNLTTCHTGITNRTNTNTSTARLGNYSYSQDLY